MAELLAQSEHLHHGAGAVLLAVPRLQPVAEFIVADWPATGRAPLRQRLGSGKRARLVAQHIEIMLEIQHMLAAAVTAFVAGDQTASMPDLDMQRMHPRFHSCARARWHRVEVGLHRDAALLIHEWEYDIGQVEAFRHAWQQVTALLGECGGDGLRAAIQHPRPVSTTTAQQQHVQRIEVGHAGDRHEMIAPEVAAFALNAALLMPRARRAELGGKPPMRAERHKPNRLLAPIATQDLAHRAGQIVVAQQVEHTAEVSEGVLMCLQECLLGGVQVGSMECRATGHRAHGKYLDLGPLVAEIDPGFIPVDLRLLSPTVTLRHERLAPQKAHLVFTLADVVAHRRLSNGRVGELRQDAAINATRRVALLARGAAVLVEHLVDEGLKRAQLRLAPFRVVVRRGQRTGNRTANNTPMDTEFCRYTGDRADPKLMLPTELLEQIHFGFPVHKRPPDPIAGTVG